MRFELVYMFGPVITAPVHFVCKSSRTTTTSFVVFIYNTIAKIVGHISRMVMTDKEESWDQPDRIAS